MVTRTGLYARKLAHEVLGCVVPSAPYLHRQCEEDTLRAVDQGRVFSLLVLLRGDKCYAIHGRCARVWVAVGAQG